MSDFQNSNSLFAPFFLIFSRKTSVAPSQVIPQVAWVWEAALACWLLPYLLVKFSLRKLFCTRQGPEGVNELSPGRFLDCIFCSCSRRKWTQNNRCHLMFLDHSLPSVIVLYMFTNRWYKGLRTQLSCLIKDFLLSFSVIITRAVWLQLSEWKSNGTLQHFIHILNHTRALVIIKLEWKENTVETTQKLAL